MNNVVQNINITDIISSSFQPSLEERKKIEEQAILIKKFGPLSPIIVRPKDGKYEIVLGIDKYEASLLAGQTKVPVIIEENTDSEDVYMNKNLALVDQPTETFSKIEKTSDVINLEELSKIKLEYERDDVKMNNDMNSNNFGIPNQGPTFGGSFFPSLEDEPTNMNMMGGMGAQSTPPAAPTFNSNEFNGNNNLIDLTDLSLDKDPNSMKMPDLGQGAPNMNPAVTTPNIEKSPIGGFDVPNLGAAPAPSTDNIINIESLQNSNQVSQPINEPVSMDILNADFGPPMPPVMDNKMGMVPNPNFASAQPNGITELPNSAQPNYGMAGPSMPYQGPSMINPQSMPGFDMNMMPPMQSNYGAMPVPPVETNMSVPKDVTPVTNTIKNLVTSLGAFGYKLNIKEEELPTAIKITIEVEK